jgi:hypothetical protein
MLIGLLVGSGLAMAAVPHRPGVIHGCYRKVFEISTVIDPTTVPPRRCSRPRTPSTYFVELPRRLLPFESDLVWMIRPPLDLPAGPVTADLQVQLSSGDIDGTGETIATSTSPRPVIDW